MYISLENWEIMHEFSEIDSMQPFICTVVFEILDTDKKTKILQLKMCLVLGSQNQSRQELQMPLCI